METYLNSISYEERGSLLTRLWFHRTSGFCLAKANLRDLLPAFPILYIGMIIKQIQIKCPQTGQSSHLPGVIKTQQLYFLEGVFKMYQRFHTTAVPGPCTHLCSPVRGSSSGVGFSELLLKCSKLGTRFHLSRATIAILFFWQSWDPNPQPVHPRQLLYH